MHFADGIGEFGCAELNPRGSKAKNVRTRNITLRRLVARRSDTTRPPDEAAGCGHCLNDFDSVDPITKRSSGAATAYMTVEKKKKEENK